VHAFALNNKIRFENISPDMTHLRPLLFSFRIKSADDPPAFRALSGRTAALRSRDFKEAADQARSLFAIL
jgi:hypothetical protein